MTGRLKELGSDQACARCHEAALVVDDVSMTLACSNCGHVVVESELVTFGDFWEGCPAGQQHFDEGAEGVSVSTQRQAESDVKRLADMVKVSPQILKEATHLLREKALRICVVKARMPVDLVAGATLCVVARSHNFPLFAADVAAACDFPAFQFAMVLANVAAAVNLKALGDTPEDAEKHQQELESAHLSLAIHKLIPQPQLQALVMDDALWILTWAKAESAGTTVPLLNLGPVLQIAAQGQQVYLTAAQVASAFRQSPRSLEVTSNKLRHGLLREANKLAWLSGQLTTATVSQFSRMLANSAILRRNLQATQVAQLLQTSREA